MRYTVTWLPGAQSALASLWVQAADKPAMSAASNRIDRLLAAAPLSVGAAHGRYRRIVLAPMEVVYSVSPPDRLVEVVYVGQLP
jgi:hypothetical protein